MLRRMVKRTGKAKNQSLWPVFIQHSVFSRNWKYCETFFHGKSGIKSIHLFVDDVRCDDKSWKKPTTCQVSFHQIHLVLHLLSILPISKLFSQNCLLTSQLSRQECLSPEAQVSLKEETRSRLKGKYRRNKGRRLKKKTGLSGINSQMAEPPGF